MFDSLIAEVQNEDRQFTVYRSGEPTEIEQWLATHGVTIRSRSLPPHWPKPFIEIKANDEVVGVIGVEAIEALIEPPLVTPGERDGISEGYRVLFDILEKTMFSGMNRQDLLAISREIEDRAFRVGNGILKVSFQTFSTFKSQIELYRTLATETDLDIHIYAIEDWTPPPISGITYHVNAAEQFGAYWVLAYDGGTDETQSCSLVGKERSGEFTGFWTNNSAITEEISKTLENA